MQPLTTLFIITGIHITENLEHHKKGDVLRILEDKGFKEMATQDMVHFYAQEKSSGDAGKRTLIFFDDGGFVLSEGGVQLFGALL